MRFLFCSIVTLEKTSDTEILKIEKTTKLSSFLRQQARNFCSAIETLIK